MLLELVLFLLVPVALLFEGVFLDVFELLLLLPEGLLLDGVFLCAVDVLVCLLLSLVLVTGVLVLGKFTLWLNQHSASLLLHVPFRYSLHTCVSFL